MQYENRDEITYMKPHHNCFTTQNLHTALLLYPISGDYVTYDIKVASNIHYSMAAPQYKE